MILEKKTLDYIRSQVSTKVLGVYLSGSHLNGLADQNSDTDYYVVTEPEFDSLIFNRRKGKQEHGEIDFKQVDLFQFVSSIYKSNPNVLELFYKKPLFTDELFSMMAGFLFDRKDDLLTLNPEHWRKACLGQMKHCYLNVAKKQGSTANGRIGKDLVQFMKAFSYLSCTLDGQGIGEAIDLNKETGMMAGNVKGYSKVPDEERAEIAEFMKSQLDEIQGEEDLNEDVNSELLAELMDAAKRTYTILCVSELSGLRAVE